MDETLTGEQRRRLDGFDRDIAQYLDTPLIDDRIMAGVQRRLRWRNTMLLVVPSAVAAAIFVYLAPALWQLLQQVVPMVPGDMVDTSVDLNQVLQVLAAMPVYVWAIVAGGALTLMTTLLES